MLLAILLVFIIGYAAIALEHPLKINKTASALLTGVVCWVLLVFLNDTGVISTVDQLMKTNLMGEAGHAAQMSGGTIWGAYIEEQLGHHLSEIAQILVFLMGAMTVVELIDMHDGFSVITDRIRTRKRISLVWIISLISFFLSSVLDNLTTAIVMVSLVNKLVSDRQTRLLFSGLVIIAANAGGAFSPIGDVTTTMLWIQGQISTQNLITQIFIPSMVSLLVPLGVISLFLRGKVEPSSESRRKKGETTSGERTLVFVLGIGGLLFVPVFKVLTHLPPYMGMMLSLGVFWIVTEFMHKRKPEEERGSFSPMAALERIDISSVLFFLGILLAVAALQSAGHLPQFAHLLQQNHVDDRLTVGGIGLLSAIVDNVPLVKAAQGMYPLADYPMDSSFWEALAFCAGTGGSILVIGSAAGVAVMGIQKMEFFWYLRRISGLALLGYLAGFGSYLLLVKWH